MFSPPPAPFKVDIHDSELLDLHRRLRDARWPDVDVVPESVENADHAMPFGMRYGPSLSVMKTLAKKWANEYDWRAAERQLNEFKQYKVGIEDLEIYFIHETSARSDAIPLILCHGWPGTPHEFLSIIHLLVNPPDGCPAFHVVVPAQPGFSFSSPPSTTWVMQDTARVFDKLMVGLGYHKYAAQGGDWGSITARLLGSVYPERCRAVHLNFCPAEPPPSLITSVISTKTMLSWLPKGWLFDDTTRSRIDRGFLYLEKGSSYYDMQRWTPRTPAYGLNDSPIGTLAWIGRQMLPFINHAQTQPDPTLDDEFLFTTCCIFYFTKSIGTSFLPYTHNPHFLTFLSDPRYFLPNFAVSIFPDEIAITPRRFVEATGRLRWYREASDGGHFAAAEKPQVLADHLREALGELWMIAKT